MKNLETIGLYVVSKYRRQANQKGVQAAARNMRKQGLPLDLALLVLARRGGDAR